MRFLISFGDNLCDHLPDQESRLRYRDKTLLSLPPSSRAKQFHVRPTPRNEQNHPTHSIGNAQLVSAKNPCTAMPLVGSMRVISPLGPPRIFHVKLETL